MATEVVNALDVTSTDRLLISVTGEAPHLARVTSCEVVNSPDAVTLRIHTDGGTIDADPFDHLVRVLPY